MPRLTARAIAWTFAISVGLFAAIVAGSGDDPPQEVAIEEPAPEPARVGSPLSELRAPRSPSWTGVVETTLPAGSYTYLALRDDDDAVRWVATNGKGAPTGSLVAVKSWGVRTDFYSRRLERSFPELEFGSVEPVAKEGMD